MTDRTGPQGGGALIAIAVIAGALIGAWRGEPSIGVMTGAGLGIAAAIILWLVDRRRA